MSLRLCRRNTGLLLFAGALFVAALTFPARAGFAQNGYSGGGAALEDRLNQIETQIQTLSSTVYRGAAPPSGAVAVPASGPGAADLQVRLSTIEDQIRTMTGQIEQASHQAQDAQARMDKLQADYDARLQALERGGGTSSSSAYGSSYIAPAAETPAPQPAPSPEAPKALGTLSSTGTTDSADTLYESAFADVRDARYDSAEAKFKQFLAQYPSSTLAGNAGYWLAETYYVRADYKQAARTFAQTYQDYPKGAKAADSLLKLGLSLGKLGKKDDACLSLQQLKKEFPGDAVPANRRAGQEIKRLGCG